MPPSAEVDDVPVEWVPEGQLSQKRKRHAELGTTTPFRSKGTYTRRKATNACTICRARKTKCDNELPVCGFCKATGGECQYSNPISSRYDQATLAILQRLDALENNLSSLINESSSGENPSTVNRNFSIIPGHSEEHETASPVRSNGLLGVSPSALSSPRESRPKAPDIEAPPSSATLFRASSEMSIEAMLQWPIFQQHLLHVLDRPLTEVLGQTLRPEVHVGGDFSRNEEPDLDPNVVYPLLENFLTNNLPSNPILDPVTLRQQVEAVVNSGLRWDGQTCLVLLVLALGSISSSTSELRLDGQIHIARNDHAFRCAETYFWASQLRIGVLYCEKHLLSAQCAFFTAVYLSFTMRIMAAWKAFAQAGTQCLAHLTSEGLMDKSADRSTAKALKLHEIPEQQVLDDSLYWVILKGEAELCSELGLPGSALHERNYPHIFPRPPTLEDLVPSSGTIIEGLRQSDRNRLVTGWFYYLGEIALKRLQNRVVKHLFGDGNKAVTDIPSDEEYMYSVQDFDKQLDQWLQTLPEPLWFSASSTEYLHDHLRWVLRGHRLDVIELLRFPAIRYFLTAEWTSPAQLSGLPPATLHLIRQYLDNAVLRIEVHVEEFMHRHQGTWLTIRGCTRSILALLGAKIKCQEIDRKFDFRELSTSPRGDGALQSSLTDALLPPRWRDAVISVLAMLMAWEEESRDLRGLKVTVETLLELCRG